VNLVKKGIKEMLNPNMQKALNKQVNAELYSSYLYLSMSAHFQSQGLEGMANWMRIQAGEELSHAMKFFDFIHDRDGQVKLTQIESPKIAWVSQLEAFEDTLSHEKKVTGLINSLVNLSVSEKDHATNTFLQWFVTEQVEEEAAAKAILDKIRLAGDNTVAIYLIDQELAKRTPPVPTATSE